MTKDTGGQAFPTARVNINGVDEQDGISAFGAGMTLRDYFAAKAMQGLLSNPKLQNEILKQGGCHSGWIETSAWAFADEMLKARET